MTVQLLIPVQRSASGRDQIVKAGVFPEEEKFTCVQNVRERNYKWGLAFPKARILSFKTCFVEFTSSSDDPAENQELALLFLTDDFNYQLF